MRQLAGLCGWVFDVGFHSVAFTLDHNGIGMMEDTVKHGRSQHAVGVENFSPVFVGLVGSDYYGTTLIAMADDLEEYVGSGLVNGQILQLI